MNKTVSQGMTQRNVTYMYVFVGLHSGMSVHILVFNMVKFGIFRRTWSQNFKSLVEACLQYTVSSDKLDKLSHLLGLTVISLIFQSPNGDDFKPSEVATVKSPTGTWHIKIDIPCKVILNIADKLVFHGYRFFHFSAGLLCSQPFLLPSLHGAVQITHIMMSHCILYL